ncbi:hypothetical protein SAMN05660236_2171 [Ohtaekwangia koreensis]|uniref:Uncharacterized protein n=2 Tax=Ohtaekwangia koreensis TaxID=688867 RepID=A0A1T5KHB6_9BACT|nr:hypothetical protein SAMN05660236_2171 [Ohtaekwangia koreensis]
MFYGGFRGGATLHQLKTALDTLFPASKASFIENGTVLISDGGMLEYAIDHDQAAGRLAFSASFHGNEQELKIFLPKLVGALRAHAIDYRLEYEVEKDGKFTTYNID